MTAACSATADTQCAAKTSSINYYSMSLAGSSTTSTNTASIKSKYPTAPTSGYCVKNDMTDMSQHANHDLCAGGSNSNIGQRFEIDFFEPNGNTPWTFTINMDSGYGYEAFFDDSKVGGMYQDVWSGDTNPKSYTSGNLAVGLHTFIVYGAEGCCDGEAGAWQFRRGSMAATPVSRLHLCAAGKKTYIHYFSMYMGSQGSPSASSVSTNANTIDTSYNSGAASASGYCSKYLTDMSQNANHDICSGGSNSNIGQRIDVAFYEPVGGVTWSFSISMDSGYGYVARVDGTQVGIMTVDVWSGDTNPKTYTSTTLSAGMHTFTVYGGEGCCDGEAGAWSFQRGSGASKTLSVDNLTAVGNGNF